MEYIALGIFLLVLAGIGVGLLVRSARYQLAGNKKLYQLEQERNTLTSRMTSNNIMMHKLKAEGDPNHIRLEAILDIQEEERQKLTKQIRELKIQEAERKALE